MSDRLREAVAFFRQDAGYERLFAGLIEKYRSLGRLGGRVKLRQLTAREREVLSAFFRRDYHGRDDIIVAVSDVADALERTRFAGIDLKAILDGYAGEVILTNAEVSGLYEYRKEQYFIRLKDEYCHPYAHLWLDSILRKEAGTRGIHRAYDQDPDKLYSVLRSILKALEQVPLQVKLTDEAGFTPRSSGMTASGGEASRGVSKVIYERLPVFASRITGDPHAFDIGTDAGRFLVSALQMIRAKQEVGYEPFSSPSAEEITELLDCFGLVRDDLLNFVTCIGILGFSLDRMKPVPLWQVAFETNSVLNVPLREMMKIDICLPGSGKLQEPTFTQEENWVFVVENSGVFSAILDALTEVTVSPPMVCTHGQFTLATLLLLDRLAENSTILYSGDFDPEGLQMAQRLVDRYQGRVRLWRYSVVDYQAAASRVQISSERLEKLRSIKAEELLSVAEIMLRNREAGYQEAFLDDLVADIREYLRYG